MDIVDIWSIGGNALNVLGWILTRDFTDPESGERQITYKGRSDALDDFLDALKQNTYYDKLEVQKEEATATVTVTKAYSEDAQTPARPSDKETALPDVTLQGSMMQVPLCQAPFFGLTSDDKKEAGRLSLQRVKMIDYLIREKGTITFNEAGNDYGRKYAGWLLLGMKTFDKPVYTLSITYHLRVNEAESVAKFVKNSGTILAFKAITESLPKRLQPYKPDGFDNWLAQAPTVRYGAKSIDVSQNFIGAKAWPEYYNGGTWVAPSIEYWPATDAATE